MTSKFGKQAIAIHIMPNISRQCIHIMKFGQLRKYNIKWGKWGKENVSRPLYSFKKALYKVKASDQHLSFDILW